MKHTVKPLLGLAALLPLTACENKDQRPNIVFFLVDDYGWLDSSVAYGEQAYPNNLRIDTPNMKRLSEMGVVMTNAYACPLSTPTRTSLMTGMHSAHEGITMFTANEKDTPTDFTGGTRGFYAGASDNAEKNPTIDEFARPEWNYNGISTVAGVPHTIHATPMVEHLRDAGYYTIHIGKAHWASMGINGSSPNNMGFLVNVGGSMAGMPASYYSTDHYGNKPGKWNYSAVGNLEEFYDTGINLTQALTIKAKQALDRPIADHTPFYLYMAHYGVHTPIHPEPEYYQKYLDRGLDEKTAMYASMVESVDTSLGDLLDYLEEKGVADNTVIIFYSDNGGHSVNDSKGGEAHRFNEPLREGKGSCYEGGVKVPMMVYWPGKTVAGTRVNTPVVPEDFYPSILEIAGIKEYDTVQELDGSSFVNLVVKGSQLAGEAMRRGEITTQKEANDFVVPEEVSGIAPDRVVVSHFPHQWRLEDQYDVDFLSAVRQGDWKLVYRMHDRRLELYNLREDIGESNDVAADNPEIVASLAKILGDKLRGWNAPMPFIRATGEVVPMPDEL